MHLLGVVDFDSCQQLQERLVYDIGGRDDLDGVLLICEHPPTLTIGRDGSLRDLAVDEAELARREIPVRRVPRGGGTQIHAPGQLAVYPLLPLSRRSVAPLTLRDQIVQSLIETCAELKVAGWPLATGDRIDTRLGQIAATGLAMKAGVSCQGVFLNVNLDPRWLQLLKTNSLADRQATLSMQRERVLSMSQVRESLVRQLTARFHFAATRILTGHPQLQRTRQNLPLYA